MFHHNVSTNKNPNSVVFMLKIRYTIILREIRGNTFRKEI